MDIMVKGGLNGFVNPINYWFIVNKKKNKGISAVAAARNKKGRMRGYQHARKTKACAT